MFNIPTERMFMLEADTVSVGFESKNPAEELPKR